MESTMKQEKSAKVETTPKAKDSSGMKWLKGFGKFLMYGGWIVVAIVVVGIIIAISVLTGGGN